jgi:hypothetical protein
MERRREGRQVEDLPIRIWGVDERGSWFTQFALARDISRGGALLMGLEQELRCGDLILLQYGTVKARFRIVWLRDSEGPYKIQAAVQKLEEDECPWSEVLADQQASKRS